MTNGRPNLGRYFNRLTPADRRRMEERLERYRDELEAEGYEVTIAEGDNGFFAGVLVIDEDRRRFGFLEEDGSIAWLGGGTGGIGSLGSAVAQRPTEALEPDVDGLENADVE